MGLSCERRCYITNWDSRDLSIKICVGQAWALPTIILPPNVVTRCRHFIYLGTYLGTLWTGRLFPDNLMPLTLSVQNVTILCISRAFLSAMSGSVGLSQGECCLCSPNSEQPGSRCGCSVGFRATFLWNVCELLWAISAHHMLKQFLRREELFDFLENVKSFFGRKFGISSASGFYSPVASSAHFAYTGGSGTDARLLQA